MSSDMQDLNVKVERTRRNIIRMSAIGASAIVANLGTINPSTAGGRHRRRRRRHMGRHRRRQGHMGRQEEAVLTKGYDDSDSQRQPQN